jgi:ribonuclease HII
MLFMKNNPTFNHEKQLNLEGFTIIIGVDEAGSGALAGPVVSGAAVLKLNTKIINIKDSKLLSEKQREEVYPQITEGAIAWGAGIATVEEIFKLGIRQATYLSMRRAIQKIDNPEFLLVDAWTIPEIDIPQRAIIKGDLKVKSIAAGSIIAKVTRDRIMRQLSKEFDQYGFDVHKGYGTKIHQAAIKKHGPCKAHRLGYKTFQSL